MNGDENMEKTLPFIKDIMFENGICEILSIALEHNLKLENNDSVVGEFIINGKYKENDISITDKKFEEIIPFDITLDDKYDSSKVKIDIDNFYYEIVDNNCLKVHIDVLISNLNYVKKEEVKQKEVITPTLNSDRNEDIKLDYEEIIKEEKDNKDDITSKITYDVLSTEDNYVTYKVHIIRENQTIEDVINLYGIEKEELEKYNSLDDIMLGSKIIIPLNNE